MSNLCRRPENSYAARVRPALPPKAPIRSTRCLLLSKFGVRNEPWLSYRLTSSLAPSPSQQFDISNDRFVTNQTIHPYRVLSNDRSGVGGVIGEGGTLRMSFSLSCSTVSGLGMWQTGGGSVAIGSVACQHYGHLGPLTTFTLYNNIRQPPSPFGCIGESYFIRVPSSSCWCRDS